MTNKPMKASGPRAASVRLLGDIRQMIEETRTAVAATVNTGLTLLYWRIEDQINREILKGKRADYGAEIISTVSRQLSWSHFKEIIYLRQPLQKEFYAEMCRVKRWNVRTARKKIASMLYERTALSKKPTELAKLELQALLEEDRLTPDLVFRDPYLRDFIGLKGALKKTWKRPSFANWKPS